MRSVFLFPRLDLARTAEMLAGLGSPNGPWEWVIDGNLYIRIEEPPFWGDWEPDEVQAVETCFGQRPGLMVAVDVSGRIDGRAEVYQLCSVLLHNGGVASDDYSDCWDLDEIQNQTRDGRRFFEHPPQR